VIPYKDDNPTETAPVVMVGLIAVNVLVYLFFRLQGPRAFSAAVFTFGLVPRELWSGHPAGGAGISPAFSILTSMFMHGGLLHLAGNMLYLWIFGNNIEDYLGHVRFLIFYLLCGLAAAGMFILFNLGSAVPMVGASGAIAGVLGAYLVLYPWARVHALVFIFFFVTTIMIPAWVLLGFWFVLQAVSSLPSLGGAQTGGVAYLAHVGGFAAGYLYTRARARKKRPVRAVSRWRG
jgi:membrane associated rhomboid family serine protease